MPVRPHPLAALILLLSTAHAGTTGPLVDGAGSKPDFEPVATRSVSANRIAETPDYAHSLDSEVNWLEFGFESRTRYEHRRNDYATPGLADDDALVTRNLLYLGIKQALDPLRLVAELEDSRRFFSDRAPNASIEDHLDMLQAYAQLHFDDAFAGAPLSISVGRMAFDAVDRRLISRNRNRNTINAFDGVRLRLGDERAPWEVDAFATQPVQRSVEIRNESDRDAILYGLTGYWRGWSPRVVLEPWWLWLDQSDAGDPTQRKNLHTFGLHAYGQWGESNAWDYDVSIAGQLGASQGRDHEAWAAHVEAGYTFRSAWKPRVALWLNYASGDRDAGDGENERFDTLFGASYAFYGYTGYFSWQNMINPAVRLSFQPAKDIKCEIMHRAIWLASDSDAWGRASRRDATGRSGSFVGQELDFRIVWQVGKHLEFDLAYAHFFPGDFADNTGRAPDSDFVQLAATLRF